MSHFGPAFYRPPKKGPPDQRTKYGVYDQNGAAGGNGVPSRYIATGASGETVSYVYKCFLHVQTKLRTQFRSTRWTEMKIAGVQRNKYGQYTL